MMASFISEDSASLLYFGQRKFVTMGNMKIYVVKNDLINEQVDVIVCSVDKSLNLRHGHVSSSLDEASGNMLQMECMMNYPNGIKNREIAVINAGSLSCQKVFLISLPKCVTGNNQEIRMVMQRCLKKANRDNYKSMAIPALGTGYLGYPAETVAKTMFDCAKDFSTNKAPLHLQKVIIVVHPSDEETWKTFQLEARKRSRPLSSGNHLEVQSLIYPNALLTSDYKDKSSNSKTFQLEARKRSRPLSSGNHLEVQSLIYPNALLTSDYKDESSNSKLDEVVGKWNSRNPQIEEVVHNWHPMNPQNDEDWDSTSISGKKPMRGDPSRPKDYFEHMYNNSDTCPPCYWTHYNKSKTIKEWNTITKEPTKPKFIPVDEDTLNDIKRVVKKTWQKQFVGRGKDAEGLQELNYTKINVTKVERVENIDVYEKYANYRQTIFKKASKQWQVTPFDDIKCLKKGPLMTTAEISQISSSSVLAKDIYPEINEHYLFHGTKEDVVKSIASQGLDDRLAQNTMLGKGIYCAESSTKADQYADDKQNRSDGMKKMFLVRACFGHVLIETKSKAYSRPPCRKCKQEKCIDHGNDFYDCVVGEGSWNFREFVFYDGAQVYPEYLISYRRA
ncbi:hypothetical protein CHS0354_030482 [Potamilus streckersoni]|uniref:Poly [ADP-ribose] polymerase n=1 Tax=Potamilus streckersoni TaxID=2493646 RepID=A0AAE0RPE1_9BIVA|nr:hypothetical protein CHS0354_030482 [Potamilus streckersoni]